MIRQGGFEGLILDLPCEFQPLINELIEGRQLSGVEDEIRDALGGLSEGWLYRNRGILESISQLPFPVPRLVCISDLGEERQILEDKMAISLLEYRGMAGGVDATSWRELLDPIGESLRRSIEKQLPRILGEIRQGGHWLWVSGVHARGAAPALAREGHSCRVVLLGKPYFGTPLEALQAELAEGNPTDERVLYLVNCHIGFLRDYVMPSSDLDEAYDRWLADEEWARLYHLRDCP